MSDTLKVLIKDLGDQWWLFEGVDSGLTQFFSAGIGKIPTGVGDEDYVEVDPSVAYVHPSSGKIIPGTPIRDVRVALKKDGNG